MYKPTTFLFLLMLGAPATSIAENAIEQRWRIINYWSVTCAPCRIEIPELNKLSEELEAAEIAVLGVNFDDDDRPRTLMLAERMGIEFPTLTRPASTALDIEPPNVLPTTVILSPEGEVKATLVGAQTSESIKQQLRLVIGAKP